VDPAATSSATLAAIQRRLWIAVVCAALVGIGAWVHAAGTARTYTATAEVLFNNASPVQQVLQLPSTIASQDAATSEADDVQLASLPVLRTLTINALKPSSLANDFDVAIADAGASDVINISATSSVPSFAAAVANTYSRQLVGYRQAQQLSSIDQAITGVQTQLSRETGPDFTNQREALMTTLSQLEALQAVKPVDVESVQSAAVPTAPDASHTARNVALGMVIGAILGFMIAMLLEWFDPRLHSASRFSSLDSLRIAPWRTKVRPLSHELLAESATPTADRVLDTIMRHSLRGGDDSGAWRLFVTSLPGAAEAQSRSAVAWDLARSAARVSSDVAVAFVALDPDVGWIKELDAAGRSRSEPAPPSRGAGLTSLMRNVSFSDPRGETRTIDVILGYRDRPSRLHDLGRFLSSRYDYLVIDASSTERTVSAGFPVDAVEAVVVTARLLRSRRDEVEMLVDDLIGTPPRAVTLITCPVGRAPAGKPVRTRVPALAPTRA
jgi:capsular polysaccharide biosynthesis protein